jgi:hypothetical protein
MVQTMRALLSILLLLTGSANAATVTTVYYNNKAQGGADPGSATCEIATRYPRPELGTPPYSQTFTWTSGTCVARQSSDKGHHFPWSFSGVNAGKWTINSVRLTCTASGTTTVELFTDTSCKTAVSGKELDDEWYRKQKVGLKGNAACVTPSTTYKLFDSGLSATACVNTNHAEVNVTCFQKIYGDKNGKTMAGYFTNYSTSQQYQIAGCSAPPPAASSAGNIGVAVIAAVAPLAIALLH